MRAMHVEEQGRIRTVGMGIDQVTGGLYRARGSGPVLEAHLLIGIAVDRGLMSPHLTPAKHSVTIVIQ